MGVFYVSPSGNDTTGDGSLGSPFLTTTKAHSLCTAGAGDFIELTAGAHVDTDIQLIITKNGVTLQGPNWDVDPTLPNARRRAEAVISGTSPGPGSILTVRADNVTIRGIKIDDVLEDIGLSIVDNDGVKLYNNIITNMNQAGDETWGIFTTGVTNADIYQNVIDSEAFCIFIGTGGTVSSENVNVHHNVVSGVLDSLGGYLSAITVVAENGQTMTNINVYANAVSTVNYGAVGIYMLSVDTTGRFTNCSICNNEVTSCRFGIMLWSSTIAAGGIGTEIHENNVDAGDIAISVHYNVDGTHIHDNTITGAELGFLLECYDGYLGSNTIFEDNVITVPVERLEYRGGGVWLTSAGGDTIVRRNTIILDGSNGAVGSDAAYYDYYGSAGKACMGVYIEGLATESVTIEENDIFMLDVEDDSPADTPSCCVLYWSSDTDTGWIGTLPAGAVLVQARNQLSASPGMDCVTVWSDLTSAYGNLLSTLTIEDAFFSDSFGVLSSAVGAQIDARNCNWGGIGSQANARWNVDLHVTTLGRGAYAAQGKSVQTSAVWGQRNTGPGGDVADPVTGLMADDDTAADTTVNVRFDPPYGGRGVSHRVKRGRRKWANVPNI